MNTGYMQGTTTTYRLPRGARMLAPQFAGSGPYGAHDPTLAGARGMAAGYGIGGGGSFTPGADVNALAGSYGIAQENARNANADLEGELKTGYADRYKRNMAVVDSMSNQAVTDVNRAYDEEAANTTLQLAKAGILQGGGTAATVPLEGVNRRRTEALTRTADAIAGRRLAVDSALSQDALMQRERVTNAYPDMNQLAGLAGAMGEGNAPIPGPPQREQNPGVGQAYQQKDQQQKSKDAGDAFTATPAETKANNRLDSYAESRRKKLDQRAALNENAAKTSAAAAKSEAMKIRDRRSAPAAIAPPPAPVAPAPAPVRATPAQQQAVASGVGSLYRGAQQAAQTVRSQFYPSSYGGGLDPAPNFMESQADYLARVNRLRRRNGLGEVNANPFTGQVAGR
jgi:hypothetical protein